MTKRIPVFQIQRTIQELINLNDATWQPIKKITKRQQQTMLLIEKWLSNRKISLRLKISEHTVKVHTWRVFRSIGAHNRSHALYILRKNNYL
jgi:DNA-binding NarL/FixJ family response regulator